MPRSIIAVGLNAIRQSTEILATMPARSPAGMAMEAGAQWRGDHMLLSVGSTSVRFCAGSTLYEQDQEGFLREEVRIGEITRPAAWLRGLSHHEMPFCMGLAGAMAPAWTHAVSPCSFLERFATFYGNHRTQLERAATELRYVAQGMLVLQHWPTIFRAVMKSMGETAVDSLPKGLGPGDIGGLLGKVLIGINGRPITLAGIPQCMEALREQQAPGTEDYQRVPQYRRLIENMERAAERVTPVLGQIRAGL